MRISRVAELAEMSTSKIRYYERMGVLPTPERRSCGYRRYNQSVLEILSFIKGAQQMGYKLAEIRKLLAWRESTSKSPMPLRILNLRIQAIEEEIAQLEAARRSLETVQGFCPVTKNQADCSECKREDCIIMRQLSSKERA